MNISPDCFVPRDDLLIYYVVARTVNGNGGATEVELNEVNPVIFNLFSDF